MDIKAYDDRILNCIDEIFQDDSILSMEVGDIEYVPIQGDDLYFWKIKSRKLDDGMFFPEENSEKEFSVYVYYSVERDFFDLFALGIKYDLNIEQVEKELLHFFSPDLYEKKFIKS
ncbi:MAG: hypothetical protein ISS01_02530 [Nanoarchaeota archaeon]|nr:hypothetical protein [Nanoarchaeota archaeon]